MLKNKKNWLALSLIPQYVLIKLLSNHPDFVERFYSNGIYIFISKFFRYTLGWIPFSVGDILYASLIIYLFVCIYKNFKKTKHDIKNCLVNVAASIAVLYFCFHFFWGLNYHRLPLHDNLNLKSDYTTEELIDFTERLIKKSNTIHLQITKNDTVKVNIPYSKSEILKLAPQGYTNLKSEFPQIDYHPKSVKKSMFSYPLTYMGFSGYLNPFTNEAQVDYMIPNFIFTTTATHEIAHQIGYAAENEANFMGCLAAMKHDDPYFKYSGYTFALRFCLNEIYERDEDLFEKMTDRVNKGILNNYKEVRDFWDAHENPTEPVFKLFYGQYLKANKQSKGLESYNYAVALLTNYFKERAL